MTLHRSFQSAQRAYDAQLPPDTSAAAERIAELAAGKLADLEWVATTLAESPLLTYSREWSRKREDGTTYIYPAKLTGAATLTALLTGDDTALLAAAKTLRAALEAEAEREAEDAYRDECDAWGAP